ncbi:MAG: hypothetical protein JOZ81_15605 [Chloroflexi bacterium]|nr:hypothetical protein [Chloroflexota bacterium]MBV9546062.1 hypothetical protein [Chloroflexota bacterium]
MPASTIDPSPNAGERPTGKPKADAGAAPALPRVFWRAVVRTAGQVSASRERDRVEWHLAACESPHGQGKHCTEGQHLIETIGHPDGHCIINGVCGLCGQPEAPAS